ncbi:hypothetical protein AX774_g8145 [Zancudomyces culisetae]|uniref:Zn(2)-C6 fungal-type domain-containing protein n=1 Tax=Zancudomyces culisetae TaxID=1213189 RepID=A0A1R1PBZ0_ZANCU|nr:hypothetical protein AX774_g8145 [Zancudomyces culisetae]|eukprot:OMH78461.1 hypothetical protein AX774_g8145 [Zancudomyces culisetae]
MNEKPAKKEESKLPKVMACTYCRKKKIKCDGTLPTCGMCKKTQNKCIYVVTRRRGRPSRVPKDTERSYNEPLPKILPKKPEDHNITHILIRGQDELLWRNPGINTKKYEYTRPSRNTTQLYYNNNNNNNMTNNHVEFARGEVANNHIDQYDEYKSNKRPRSEVGENMGGSVNTDTHVLINGVENKRQFSVGGIFEVAKQLGNRSPTPTIIVPAIPPPMTSKAYQDPGIMAFFHYFNTQIPLVHWPSFREAYDDGTVPKYLVLAMRALSRRYSKQPSVVLSENLYSTGMDLAAISSSLAEIAMQQDPTTSLIQTLLLLSIYEFGIGNANKALDRRKSAIQIAYKTGINQLDSRPKNRRERALIIAENCRRVWWLLLYCDRFFTMILSRPEVRPIIDEGSFRVRLPSILVYSDTGVHTEDTINTGNAGSAKTSTSDHTTDYPAKNNSDTFASGNSSITDDNQSSSKSITVPTGEYNNEPNNHAQPKRSDAEFGQYDDVRVVRWHHTVAPFTLIIGHIMYQRQVAFRLFGSNLRKRPIAEILSDSGWLSSLSEFLRNYLVIDAEITQWESALGLSLFSSAFSPCTNTDFTNNNDDTSSHHSFLSASNYHNELKFSAVVIQHQLLGLYVYNSLKNYIQELSIVCIPILWLKSVVSHAWQKIAIATENIRVKGLQKLLSVSENGGEYESNRTLKRLLSSTPLPSPPYSHTQFGKPDGSRSVSSTDLEWEFYAPHASYLYFISAKVAITLHHLSKSITNVSSSTDIKLQLDSFTFLLTACKKYWNDRDYLILIDHLLSSPSLFADLDHVYEHILLELDKKLSL